MRAGIRINDFRSGSIDETVPAAAKRLVKGDIAGRNGDLTRDQRIFGGIERTLRLE